MKHTNPTLLCIVLLVTFGVPAGVLAQQSYSEDFTTTTYKDVLNTTADWNTDDGELKLFPFIPTLAGSYDTPGDAWDVTKSGNHVFVADGLFGLQVIDVTDPMNPVLVGNCDTAGSARGIVVSGDHAFVADYGSGLQVIDVSDPANPMLVGTYNTPGYAYGVTVSGDHAFVADGGSGLQVIDISDPTNPTLAGSYDTPGSALDITVSGDHAYVADFTYGLQVIDISDPANPMLAGTYNTPGRTRDVLISGDHIFVADDSSGLQVIDISDPANPMLVGTCNTPGYAYGVAVSGDHAYVADYLSGLQVIDISDPTSPTLLDNCDTPGVAYGVAVSGDHAFVTDYTSGLQVIVISDPMDPTLAGSCDTPGSAGGVAVSGDHAFVADSYTGLQVIDISDPANPTLAGSYDTPGSAGGVAVSGDHAFVADFTYGLQVIDISDPANPTLAGSCDTPGSAYGVAVSGDYAFVADWASGLQVIDISDPTSPTLAGNWDTLSSAEGVAVSGDHALVADNYSGLRVIDISDPANPTLAGTCDTPGSAGGVAVSGDHAFVADHLGLQVIDISDPTNPTLAGNYDTMGGASGVTVSGNYAFMADFSFGLRVIEISDPANPTLVGTCDTPGSAGGVAVSGDHAFVADSYTGLQVIRVFLGEFYTDNNAGRSLFVDASNDTILQARLTATQTDSVGWELSADGGVNWQGIVPDGSWNQFAVPGTDLLWRSTHTWVASGVNPGATQIEIDWLLEPAPITSIIDVPDDQGRSVNLSFPRSGYDFLDETEFPVVGYAIYRRLDDPLLMRQVKNLPAVPAKEVLDHSQLASFGPDRVRRLEDRTFIVDGNKSEVGTLPPGVWEGVGWLLPTQSDTYTARVNTLADSTASGTGWSVFVTAVHTSTPAVWFASQPDSGYSLDNIAPGVPQSILAGYLATGVALDWADAPESDFQYYRIYRDTDPEFVPSPDNLLHETAVSAWTDPMADPWDYYYKITVLDHAGNESEAGSPESVSGVRDGGIPTRTALLGAVPNPFNPSTKLSFEIGTIGHVRLKVFDAAGRLVTTLIDEFRVAGLHEVSWDGRDATGRMSSAGVYLYRLEMGVFSETKRMVLIK